MDVNHTAIVSPSINIQSNRPRDFNREIPKQDDSLSNGLDTRTQAVRRADQALSDSSTVSPLNRPTGLPTKQSLARRLTGTTYVHVSYISY